MKLTNYLELVVIASLPVVVSVLFYWFFQKESVQKRFSYPVKQIIVGIVFGGLAVLGTEKGVLIHGATLNARDAAPLCAALIFGGPAGIIAGVIGGLERYFAVYWGAGAYTQVACTIATIFSGCFGALLKKFLFDNEIPGAVYGFATGLVAEVLHMMMVFLTHMSDIKKAFTVVEVCTIPMIIVNSIACFVTVYLIRRIEGKKEIEDQNKKLSVLFQRNLLIVVVIAYIITSGFTFIAQQKIADVDANQLLEENIVDVENDIHLAADTKLLEITHNVADYLKTEDISNELLKELLEIYGVCEIHVVNASGIILYSSEDSLIHFDMKHGEQASAFMCLVEQQEEYVQEMTMASYANVYRKYAGVSFDDGFVQVAYDLEEFYEELGLLVEDVAKNRHVGEAGYLLVLDNEYNIVSANEKDLVGTKLINDAILSAQEDIRYEANFNGEDIYYMVSYEEGYIIISILPISEVTFSRDLAIYLNTFMEILVFAGLFILTFFLVREFVVLNINKVDDSLSQITEGNLDVVVEVNKTSEFESLSHGINEMVTKLKQLILEANQRIDAELQYAADIQRSALPSLFPPFPSKADLFDIYASMDPAKEVGGDFYDFYLYKKNILVFLIADVSGKGIPASLFMMRAKTLLKTYAEGGLAVNDIFTNANYNLCEGNDAGMFVTAWMGMLDLRNGELKYANAGHNPPVIKRKDGQYEYLRSKPGFILGGMEEIAYKEFETHLDPGDEIYLYTDGVTEATDIHKELFGEERLLESLNRHCLESSRNLCENVKKDVDNFVGEAPQFDDMTMLSIKMLKYHVHVSLSDQNTENK